MVESAELERQLCEWGMTLEKTAQQPFDEHCWVLPENWSATQLFLRSLRLTRKTVISGMTGVQIIVDGFDLPQVMILVNAYYPNEDTADLLSRLAILEDEYVKVVNG